MREPPDEFAWIAGLRPLTRGDPRALDLMDDAAIVPSLPGQDLVISKDAMVEGVHVLEGEDPGVIARRMLRTALSDLAAKGAEPFGYFLLTAWPSDRDAAFRRAFAEGLAMDGPTFGVSLLGGDTVATPGPLVVSATVLGWVPAGRAVLRGGARAGDLVVVCGGIGDGYLGLRAARGEIADEGGMLARRYRLPEPLLALRTALREHAHAAADVSDGLLADVGHIAAASGCGVSIELDRLPVSREAGLWRQEQPDVTGATLDLAAGGDDYAIVCAVSPGEVMAFREAAERAGIAATVTGVFEPGAGLTVSAGGTVVEPSQTGWRH